MTKFIQMFSRNLKIAMIVAFACVCVRPAMAEQAKTDPPPAKEAQTPPPAKESQPQSEKKIFEVIRLIRLRYSDADTMARVLDQSISGRGGLRIAIDKQKNSVILMGSEEQLQTAEELIRKLDSPGPNDKAPSSPVSIRIIWLVEGDQNAAAPADNLKDVVEELQHQGLVRLGQVAQTVVRSQYEGTFQISCSPLLENKPTTLTASGRILTGSKLQIRISATEANARLGADADQPGEKLINLDVNTVFKTNDYIVLAVAPIGKITSVFVIQITDSNP